MNNLFRNKLAVLLLLTAAGCSHPLETNLSNAVSVSANTYRIAKTVDNPSSAYMLAQKHVKERLKKKGFRHSENGQIYLTITLSDRAANSSVSIKKGQNTDVISEASEKAFLKFCYDNAIKLSVIMNNISDGKLLYQGSATRRRCNINEDNSIKYLAKVATSSLLPQ